MTLLPTFEIDSAYTQEQLTFITDRLAELGNSITHIQQWEGPDYGKLYSVRNTCDFQAEEEIRNTILSGLPKDIADKVIGCHFFHLKSFRPVQVHSDYGWCKCDEDETPYYIFLIPLETVNSYTIVLDQVYEGTDFIKYKEEAKPLPKDKIMSVEEYNKWFSHCWPQERPFISIQKLFKWKAGSILGCDIRYLHASDNYLKDELAEKNCLVLMSKTKINA